MQPVSSSDSKGRIELLLGSLSKEGSKEDALGKVREIGDIIGKDRTILDDGALINRVFTAIDALPDPAIQEMCRTVLLDKAPSTLSITEEQLENYGQGLWSKIKDEGIKRLVIERDGEPIVYEERVLQKLAWDKLPVKALTTMCTLKFEGGAEPLIETKANLHLCGDYIKETIENISPVESEISFAGTPVSREAFASLLQEIKTGKRVPKESDVLAAADFLGYLPPIPECAFGKAEWEKAFPITIDEVPHLPLNIHEILELEDPTEPGKKLKETCMLFLRPEKVNFQGREISLTFNDVEELAKNGSHPRFRACYDTFPALRERLNQMPVAKAGWVLMRKEVIPGTTGISFQKQQEKLKGSFEVPKIMDAILLNFLVFATEGKFLYGRNPWINTRCQETHDNQPTVVGCFAFGHFGRPNLMAHISREDHEIHGLSGTWKL